MAASIKFGEQVRKQGFRHINVFVSFPTSNSGCQRNLLKMNAFVLFCLFFKFKNKNYISSLDYNNFLSVANYEYRFQTTI